MVFQVLKAAVSAPYAGADCISSAGGGHKAEGRNRVLNAASRSVDPGSKHPTNAGLGSLTKNVAGGLEELRGPRIAGDGQRAAVCNPCRGGSGGVKWVGGGEARRRRAPLAAAVDRTARSELGRDLTGDRGGGWDARVGVCSMEPSAG